MEIYNITVPIYAASREEAESAQSAMRTFVENFRNRNIAVTGRKVSEAMSRLQTNGFAAAQIENFLKIESK